MTISMPPEVLDQPPQTDDDRTAILNLILEQLRELVHLTDEKVTCPCGNRETLLFAYHCYHCGVWFCRSCAPRHFGEPA